MIEISRRTARALSLRKQGLWTRPRDAGRCALLETVRRIGIVQLDSANVVERSHYLVLLSRLGPYDKADLDALVHPEAKLLEQWVHCASLIPAEDYRHFLPLFRERRREPLSERKRAALGSDPQATLKAIHGEVARNGPRRARDFPREAVGPRTWWNRKPERIGLDHLAYTGELIVERRIGFECSYDLTERVVPQDASAGQESLADFSRWMVLRSIGCMGVATAKHVSDYYRQPLSATRPALKELLDEGKIVAAVVEGWKHEAYFLTGDLDELRAAGEEGGRSSVTALLSPFDSLIWHRERVRELFGFEFKNEMYTPLEKRERVYGYFVMPILHRGALVGRVDPKVDRKERRLRLRNVVMEPWVEIDEGLVADLCAALGEFMVFHGCDTIQVEQGNSVRLNQAIPEYCNAEAARWSRAS